MKSFFNKGFKIYSSIKVTETFAVTSISPDAKVSFGAETSAMEANIVDLYIGLGK